MYAMQVKSLDGPRALERVDASPPKPARGEVVIEVAWAGCNFFDTLITRGRYQVRPELPFAPGAEVSGVVSAVGADARGFAVGDRVLGLLPYGGYATHVAVPASRAFAVPDEVPLDDACAMGIVYQTSYIALHERAGLRSGERLLVHAAAGGVGLAAVELGAAAGAEVIGTAGSERKLELARAHGATHALSYRDASWVDAVRALTGGRGADVIYDPVGGDTFDASTKCIAFGGRLLVIGFASGRIPTLEMNRVLLKNIAVVGTHWGAYFEHASEVPARAQRALFDLHRDGTIHSLIGARHPLVDAARALEALAGRETVGKVLLSPT